MQHDLISAVKALRRTPGFLAVVVITLGLGIGGAVGIFSLVNTLLFRPLPFEEESSLVRMRDAVSRPGEGEWRYNSSPRSFVAMQEEGRVFDGIVAQRYRPMILSDPGEPERVVAIGVSAGWAEVLGVGPILGRAFTADEEELGTSASSVLLGHELWVERFGGTADVLGETVRLDDRVYTVVGVMPRTYNYPYGADLWVPDTFDRDDVAFGPNVVGRLRTGLGLESAQGELDRLSTALAEQYPGSHASIRLLAVPIRDDLVSNSPQLGWALLLGAGVLLLLACFNIANLLLVRGEARQGELAVRASLGAGAWRQARQLLLESVLMGLGGAVLGLGLAAALQRVMARLSLSADSSLGAFFTDLGLDWRVAAFALLLGVGTAVVFGVIPAVRAARISPREALTGAGRGRVNSGGQWLNGLITAELAVALVLLAASALMVENMLALRGGDRGHAIEDRMTFEVGLTGTELASAGDRIAFMGELLDRIGSEPSVRTVGAVHHLPFDDGSSSVSYSVQGGPSTEGERRLLANLRIVAGAYFEAMGIQLEAGRAFTSDEMREVRDVVVVNRAFADRYWPEGALGSQIKLGALDADEPWLTVVGVVATAEEDFEIEESLYVPYPRGPTGEMAVVALVPGTGDHGAVLRRAVRDVDPGQPLAGLNTVRGRLAETLSTQTAATRLMIGFGAFGLLLAGLGIFGVMAYSVRRRKRELAVRQALGLTRTGAVLAVLRAAAGLVLVGVAIGVPAALGFTTLLTRVLGGTTDRVAIDIRLLSDHAQLGVSAYAGIALLVVLATLTAAAAPAIRAARADPARALREQ